MSTNVSRTELELEGARDVMALNRIAALADDFGAARLAADARSLAERVAEGRFYVACVGQFKRGKSTLLNALVHDALLPTGIVPLTTVPTILRFGSRSARVRLQSGEWKAISPDALGQYVSEEHNPQNAKGVTAVEAFVPSPLLASGMCLVDTPGLGSVFEANTAATREFIPHIDAAIVLIGADPPLSGDELELVESVAHQVQHLLFVLNKADRASEPERKAAMDFSRRTLEQHLGRGIGPIFQISAVERMENRGPERDWPALVRELEELAERSGQVLTRSAAERGLLRLCTQLLAVVREEREALVRPIEQSERRIAALDDTIAAAERSLGDLSYLFTGEQRKLSHLFEQRRNDFLKRVRAIAQVDLERKLAALPRRTGPRFRREAMRAAQETARHHVMPWLETEQAQAEQAYSEAARRFIELANEFLRRIAAAGLSGVAALPENLEAEEAFRTASKFCFYDFLHIARPASPLRYLADLLLGMVRQYEPVAAEAREFLDLLLETNASRVQSDLDERVAESRRRLESEIRALLREISSVAGRALARARSAQQAGSAAVEAELSRLAGLESELRSLQPAGQGEIGHSVDRVRPEG